MRKNCITLLLLIIVSLALTGCHVPQEGSQWQTTEPLWYPGMESTAEKTDGEQLVYDRNMTCMTDANISPAEATCIADFFLEYYRSSRVTSSEIKSVNRIQRHVETAYCDYYQPYIQVEMADGTAYWFSLSNSIYPNIEEIWQDGIGDSLIYGVIE